MNEYPTESYFALYVVAGYTCLIFASVSRALVLPDTRSTHIVASIAPISTVGILWLTWYSPGATAALGISGFYFKLIVTALAALSIEQYGRSRKQAAGLPRWSDIPAALFLIFTAFCIVFVVWLLWYLE